MFSFLTFLTAFLRSVHNAGRNFIFLASLEKLWTFNLGKSFSGDTICLPFAGLTVGEDNDEEQLETAVRHVLNVFFVSLLSKE